MKLVNGMIEKVKIGHVNYEVIEVDCIDVHQPLDGQILFYDQLIKIREGLFDEKKRETLLHEILHGIEDHFELDLEEEVIVKFGKGLAMVFMDNPELLNYLRGVDGERSICIDGDIK